MINVRAGVAPQLRRGWTPIAVGLLLLGCLSGWGEILPVERRTNWQLAGVPGGIPHRTNIFCNVRVNIPGSPNVAYGDGFRDDSQAINDAISLCPSNMVIYVPAGTYRLLNKIKTYSKSYWTLRGDGPGKTIFVSDTGVMFDLGTFPSVYQWPAANAIVSGASQGSTNLTLTGTGGIAPGALMHIEQSNDGLTVFGYGSGANGTPTENAGDRLRNNTAMLNQRVMVTGVSGNQVTFYPPLNFGFDPNLGAQAVGFGGFSGCSYAGLEDLTVSGSTGGYGVLLQGDYACWLKNVEITNWREWGVEITFSVSCEVRECFLHEPAAYNWSTGYAYQFDLVNNCLTENNVFWHCQLETIMQGCCSGNVFGYNAAYQNYDGYLGIQFQLESFYANHTPYPYLNLFEGNFGNAFHADFYYGPSAKATLLRNYFTGTDPDISQNRICVNMDSHQWSNSVIGNVLGSVGTNAPFPLALARKTILWTNSTPLVWGYDPGTANFSYTSNVIFRLGYPYSGNNGGTPPYADGGTNHLDGYDLLVHSNTLIHGNWDYSHKAIVWDPNIPDHSVPNSYYLSGKPSWFGSMPWPPFDPARATLASLTNLPAGYRLVFGAAPPSRTQNLPPIAVASASVSSGPVPLAVSFSSAGSGDPEGSPLSFLWTFGDGATSTAANPAHVYRASGTYTVGLAVSDGFNTSTSLSLTISANVPGDQPPVAYAAVTSTNGFAPLTVAFSSAGSLDPDGAPLAYSWNFGDGSTSSAPNPSHTYAVPGIFSASLIVSDGAQSSLPAWLTVQVQPSAASGARVAGR